MNIFHVYLHFPDNLANRINSKEEGCRFIKRIQILIDRADCEMGAVLYFDNSSKDIFLSELQVLESKDLLGYFGSLKFEEVLNFLIVEANISNWESNPIHDVSEETCYYRLWDRESRTHIDGFPVLLKEVAERDSRRGNKDFEKCLFINIESAYPTNNPVSMIRCCNSEASQFICFEHISNFYELEKWFLQNRIKRVYNLSDNRHIENHQDYRQDKSPLLGGIAGKANASKLLETAIGDKREKNYLINFDNLNHCHIRFEDENAQNQYHGYHLVKPIIHEIDKEAESKMPERVTLILQYRTTI